MLSIERRNFAALKAAAAVVAAAVVSTTVATKTAVLAGAFAVLTACAEQAGGGSRVPIPAIRVECLTAGCRSTGAIVNAFVIYTTSSCTNPSFGEIASGSGSVSCSGAGCTGTVASFTDSDGLSVTSIPDGSYSVCVTIDRDGNYSGVAQTGDSTGTLATNLRSASATTVAVSLFVDL